MRQKREITKLKKDLFKVHNSLSWKITSPLRFIGSKLKFIKDIIPNRRQNLSILISQGTQYLFKHGPVKFIYRIIEIYKSNKISQANYHKWIETVEKKLIEAQIIPFENFTYNPKISILLPVFEVELIWLKKAIESVINQTYTNWELCIHDDCSKKYAVEIHKLLEEYANKDNRIKFSISNRNQHISLATNQAFKLSTGDFVTFLDHDDEISEDALYFFVKELNRNPKLEFIYSDEDKISIEDIRLEPIFKPDWSPDTSLSMMYTTHLSIYKKEIFEKLGGYRNGFEGSQDYDFLLRATEIISEKNISHIPLVLYHWRQVKGSTSLLYNTKSYALPNSKKAILEALKRRKLDASITYGLNHCTFKVKRTIKNSPLISIIIPTYNQKNLLERCINSIYSKTTYKNFEIIVVNNNSDDKKTLEYLKTESNKFTVIDYPHKFNYSAINNFAIKHAKGQHILLLNNDTEIISAGWLSAMLEHSQRSEVGAVGAKLLYPDNSIQHAGVILGIGGVAGHSHKFARANNSGYLNRINIIQNISAVTGACLMVKKKLYQEVGGLDEKNLTIAFNDVDFCLKLMQAGYKNIYTPYAKLYHHESKSRGAENTSEKQKRFNSEVQYMLNKWKVLLEKDPYYNSNLTLIHENFGLS